MMDRSIDSAAASPGPEIAGFGRWLATTAVLAAYFGLILTIAFAPELVARRIGGSLISVGMIAGVAIILFSVGLCLAFTRYMNRAK